ncbi:Hypothetical protein NAEGRDRAFT_80902 [Naegleria gruberi]|uniref:Guanylate cyclase domain-containing protein n=1 Tax=Naegleria gruberi TaxID=5762 RepID=D2VQT9_NAEGR|nr:uncharacterized protein NAEGRDRAFT_80902 [Naegleria gruberi]EFC40769.1 Hypothetical protein NAEGRDRAFT_80902 [Naegleria gruberi]|eukprot:XP_002673513.1 Hypothetical protein NAEGRDRAFT_80902 [Naegleria gruberi strain NEG-M]
MNEPKDDVDSLSSTRSSQDDKSSKNSLSTMYSSKSTANLDSRKKDGGGSLMERLVSTHTGGSTANLIQSKHSIYALSTSALIPQDFFGMARSTFSDGKPKDMTVALFQFSGLNGLNSNDENVFINNFLTLCSPIIQKQHGIFHKFFDDYFIVVFEARHSLNAIECAFDCIDTVRKNALECSKSSSYSSNGAERNYLLLENINIVIHTCPCKVGPVHFNDKHSDFLIMTASKEIMRRMANLGRMYDIPIVVSSQVVQKSDALTSKTSNQAMNISPFGKFFLSNSPYDLFQVYDSNWDVFLYSPDRRKDFKTSLDMFQQRKFIAAMNTFSKLHRMNDNDKLSLLYVKVCRMYQQSELPPQWDGVVMLDKDCEPFPLGKKPKGYYIQAGISASFHLGDEQFMSHGKDKEEEIRLLTESLNQKALMIKDMKEILSVKETELAKLHEITELLMKEKKQLQQQVKQNNERKAVDKVAKKQLQHQQSTGQNEQTAQNSNPNNSTGNINHTQQEVQVGCLGGLLSCFGGGKAAQQPKRNQNRNQAVRKKVGNRVTPVNQ